MASNKLAFAIADDLEEDEEDEPLPLASPVPSIITPVEAFNESNASYENTVFKGTSALHGVIKQEGKSKLALAIADDDDDEEDEPLPLAMPSTLASSQAANRSSSAVLSTSNTTISATAASGVSKVNFALNLDEIEEEEEDMPLVPLVHVDEHFQLPISQDFIDAQRTIDENCYDVRAWRVYLDEVLTRKSGTVTIPEAYSKLLLVFPRAAKYWKALVSFHLSNNDLAAAEEAISKADIQKCRSVDLWSLYIDMVRRNTFEKKKCEELFEDCLKNVGLACNSGVLWKKYLDYVSEIRDPTRLLSLRRIYQRALSVPMDGLDTIWSEYEKLERSAGEHLADQLLPEYSEKYTRASKLYKERRRIMGACDFDILAGPPTDAGTELAELECWNRWIRYEMKNADIVEPEQHKQYMLMLYDQFVCCFRHHSEAWIASAQYSLQASGVIAGRGVFREAIDIIPSSELLRIAYAEMEEQQGSLDMARDILKAGFHAVPSTLMFSSYQKFLRRNEGLAMARKAFSEYIAMLKKTEKILDAGICISHAIMELDVNNEPQIALKIMEYSKSLDASIATSVSYIKTMSKILLRTGDHQQLQWLFTSILEPAVTDQGDRTDEEDPSTAETASLSPQEIADVWDEFFRVEASLGLSTLTRLNELRARRTEAFNAYDESLRGKLHVTSTETVRDVTHGVMSILERFEYLDVPSLGELDGGVWDRCVRLSEPYESRAKLSKAAEGTAAGRSGAGGRKRKAEGAALRESLKLVSAPVRDFITRLPVHYVQVNSTEVSAYLDHLRRIVLPARPADDGLREMDGGSGAHGQKRFRDQDEQGYEEDSVRESVFSQRQRARLGM